MNDRATDSPPIAHGGEVRWFSGYRPGDVLGACPHTRCPHNATNVIAWGPDFKRYELVECDATGDGCCAGTCRAWIDHRARVTTEWLAIHGGVTHQAPTESRSRTSISGRGVA
jgi:hypothetical protein